MDGSTKQAEPRSRWMIRRDMPEIVAIESLSFSQPWDEDEFLSQLRNAKMIGKVVELDEKIVGFVIYQLRKTSLEIVNIAVHPDHRRTGIGRQMLADLFGKLLRTKHRNRVFIHVPETMVGTQMWLKACEYRADKVVRDLYDDMDDDAYRFVRNVVIES